MKYSFDDEPTPVKPEKEICLLCNNERYIYFPDFYQIKERKIWTAIFDHLLKIPITNVACPLCRPDGLKLDGNTFIYSLRQSVNHYNKGEEYLNLMRLVIRHWLLVKKDSPVNYNYWLNLIDIEPLKGDYNQDYWKAMYGDIFIPSQTSVSQIIKKAEHQNVLPF